MNLKILTPKQSLNKAYLKEKISRTDIEVFKVHFTALVDKINDKGDEEHLKSLIADFLKLTYYNQSQNQINPIGKNDLVIHTGKSPADPYGVILEIKSPANKSEMIITGKANVKAFHELILYYLDERIGRNRNELKQLIITNIYDWYIIDANEFDKKIYRNAAIKKLYDLKKSDNKDNPWFYDELKKLFDNHSELSIDATFFDLRDFKKIIANANRQDDKGLISLYKILSPVHLLKLPFANDSNTLQPKFYSELLHLIGLYEYKEGSKKLISRKKEGERNSGSLLENAIAQLERHDKIARLEKPSQYGENYEQRLYAAALELVITWINRILFLKLLEAQLINYHKGDRDYTFLTKDKIKDFDDLDQLFFSVLAKRVNERSAGIQKLFGKVPYLNSSLFEPTELEQQTLFINSLENDIALPVTGSTVLKDANGKTLKGGLATLDYLFAFLNAYDFSSEGAEEIQEDNKQLINASVLGLIFEKINGYKDGSFFTPGFITMYMCRETIRRAFIQKINERIISSGHQNFKSLETITDVYNQIGERLSKNSVNEVLNNLKICDPAVGSGHFLVSALNEIIAIKSELRVLTDREGRGMHHYGIEVVNDELIITDEDGNIFEYNPNSKESQRVQETLFHEKQTIIENCLFGVDINPNSVKICRLRLWIELLKNSYYKAYTNELETLPNIDINIKVGNSLISRFALDADLKQALRGTNWNINDYRIAVGAYKNATDKNARRELVTLIDKIKSNFRASILNNGKEYKELSKLRGQLDKLLGTNEDLFGVKKNKEELEFEQRRLEISIENQEAIIEDIKNNKIYQNAFEWRFEFPEVLNDDGDFMGFDVVIGNPPYVLAQNLSANVFDFFKSNYYTATYKIDTYQLFYELGFKLLESKGHLSFISPNTFLKNKHSKNLRALFIQQNRIIEIVNFYSQVFEDASVDTLILMSQKSFNKDNSISFVSFSSNIKEINSLEKSDYKQSLFNKSNFELEFDIQSFDYSILEKLQNQSVLADYGRAYFGIQTFDRSQYVSSINHTNEYYPVIDGTNIKRYYYDIPHEYVLFIKSAIKSGGDYTVYKRRRIVVRQIGVYPEGTIVPSDLLTLNTVYNIFLFNNDFPLEYLLGLINSRLIKYYWKKKFYDNKATFPKIKKAPLESIPVAKYIGENAIKIKDIVIEILSNKIDNSDSDTSVSEKQIDQLVYQLYGLTEEEIKIVEGV